MTTPAVQPAGPREWIGLAVLALACVLYAMDLRVLHLAVPSLSADLQPSRAQLLWITDIYGFILAGFLIAMGTLGDRIRRRRYQRDGPVRAGRDGPYTGRVDTLVAHEPPAMNLLPDGAAWRAAFQSVVDTYRRDGAGPAMQQFITMAVRTGSPQSAKDDADAPGHAAPPPPMPDMSQLPPEVLEGMARMQANSQFFLAHMLPTTIEHTPDVAGLQAASARIVLGAGEASQGQMAHRAALALAERLDTAAVTFPGDHQGFATHPEPFAETIHKALHDS